MLIQIKNAGLARKESILVPYSNFKYAVATVLLREGYIASLNKKTKKGLKMIEIGLAYNDDASRIGGVKRVSKLSRRIYMRAQDIRPVRQGSGLLVLSTPKGVLTGGEARKEKVGGEALFTIW